MQSGDYRHLREVFTEMALQHSDSPDGSQRWLAVAQTCFDLEQNWPPLDGARKRRGRRCAMAPRLPIAAENLRPQLPAARQDKTVGRAETAPPGASLV
jgi:hypothetical protein